jgi:beta-glucosidase
VLLEKMADNKRVFYKDIGKVFLSEQGVLSKDIMPDLLHLSAKGYELWAQAIEKDVVRLLEEESESAPKK